MEHTAMEFISVLSVLTLLITTCGSNSDENGTPLPTFEPQDPESREKRQIYGDFCKNRADGELYADPEDCRGYVYCSGGYAYKSRCEKGLYYDLNLRACNYDTGKCADKQKKLATPEPGATSRSEDKQGTKRLPSKMELMTELEDFCVENGDGTYPNPDDCYTYILCSNAHAYKAQCPDGLVYDKERNSCDFSSSGACPTPRHNSQAMPSPNYGSPSDNTIRNKGQNPGSSKGYGDHNYDGRGYQGQDNHLSGFNDDNGMSKKVSAMMPQAIERAMAALTDKLKQEAQIAKQRSGRQRPFKLVQKFLTAKPLAKQLSMPAFVLANASKSILLELGMGSREGATVMERVGPPLPPTTHRVTADSPFPAPDPATCPWPRYTCPGPRKYRSFDGSCNNQHQPLWGRAFTPFKRFLPPRYGDGRESFRKAHGGGELPNPREISYQIHEDVNLPSRIHTTMLMQWGQFLDHDLTLTAISKIVQDPSGYGSTVDIECGKDGCSPSQEDCAPIPIPANDPDFTNKKCLEFVRSQDVPNFDCTIGPRQQLNQLTSYIDASNVYGSSKEESDRLRDLINKDRGQLRTSTLPHVQGGKHMLPQHTGDRECEEFDAGNCFLAGDERVNEQNALTTVHILWLREHNHIEAELHRVNPHWDGNTLYQETRRIVGAMMQQITYHEFLPLVLGPAMMKRYEVTLLEDGHFRGYDSTVDASIANAFATAAFRFGHSMLVPAFRRMNATYGQLKDAPLSESFFRPSKLLNADNDGIDGFVRGLCSQNIQSVDRFITKQVTAHLFAQHPPNGLGTDLVSLNIQRGRDHGLPGYNAWRMWCGLPRANTFSDLVDIKDKNIRNRLKTLYRHVDDIDLFPGGLAEARTEGGLIGPTFACIIGNQFRNLRRGDRFWYENDGTQAFTEAQINEIRKVRLSKVICDNGNNISLIQPSVMEIPFRDAYPDILTTGQKDGINVDWHTRLWLSDYNARVNCSCLPHIDFSKWKQY